jgi:hypothetical protein
VKEQEKGVGGGVLAGAFRALALSVTFRALALSVTFRALALSVTFGRLQLQKSLLSHISAQEVV